MKMAIEINKFVQHSVMVVVAFLYFSNSVSSFNSSEGSDYQDHQVNSDKLTASYSPCFARFVVEPYFKKHGSFNNSSFQEYVVHHVPFNSHTTVLRLLDLERHLIGEGSHRHLSSSIRFRMKSNEVADFSAQICEVIIIERLPSGVFADPFELKHLLQLGAFNEASVFGDTNLELPSFLSNRSIVEVHLDLALDNSAKQEVVKDFKIQIPLHARYPPLEESGYSKVKFGAPDLFVRCKIPGESLARSCSVTPVDINDLKLDDAVVWIIPAGIKDHAGIVSAVTFTCALLSAISIIIVSIRHARMESNARLKQS